MICWHCARELELPPDAVYCHFCGHSMVDRFSSPVPILDARTGLFNSAFMTAIAGQEVVRALRYKRPLSVLVIEVDEAETICDNNEELSQLLYELGQVINGSIRDSDTVGYLGGDHYQFGVVLPETSIDGALKAAEYIQHSVVGHPFTIDGHQQRVTISVGGVEISQEFSNRDEDVLALAAAVLAQSRADGPGRTRVHSRL